MNKSISLFLVLFLSLFFTSCENSVWDRLVSGGEDSSFISGDLREVDVSAKADGEDSSFISGDLRGMSALEIAIVKEINKVRTDPEGWMLRHNAAGGEMWMEPADNPHTMKGRQPVPQLAVTYGLTRASVEHADTQTNSHTWAYVDSYVNWGGGLGQNMAPDGIIAQGKSRMAQAGYNNATDAEALVYEYIRDSGNSDKGHRENIMGASFHFMGTGYRSKGNVMNFAVSATDK